MNKIFFILIIFFVGVLLVGSTNAATYTVGSGRTYSTIQACHNAASSGDICLITPGTYTEMVSISRPGITFAGQSFQTATVIGGFNIQRAASGTTVKDLRITSLNTQTTAYPIYIAADNAKIYDNYFYDIWGPSTVIYSGPYSGSTQSNGGHVKGNKLVNVRRGLWIMGNNYLVENNEIDGLIGYNGTSCPLTNSDGTEASCGCDYMWFHGNNMVIRNNYWHGALKAKTGGSHLDCFQTAADIPAWNTFNTLFENNTCINFDHFILWDNRNNQMGNWTIRNNLAVQNDPTRTTSWAEIYNKDTAGIKIEHNTIGGYTWGPAIWFENNSAYSWSPSGSIKYNILFRSAQPYRMNFNCGTACDIGYNVFWNTGAATPAVSTNIVANPLFVDEANGNYRLQPNSPACNINGTYAGAFPCDGNVVCTNGQNRSCNTNQPGICAIGIQTCSNNNWGLCIAQSPQTEICGNNIDEDCNGLAETCSVEILDSNSDSCISLGEISNYVSSWLNGNGVTLSQVSSGVSLWLQGCSSSNPSSFALPSDYSIDWSPGIPGGIPNYAVGANIMDYGAVGDGVADDTQALINAIAATPEGTALYIPSGKYRITSEVLFARSIAIRGAGPENTKLICVNSGCIAVVKYGASSSFTSVTGGATKGSTQVTVSNSALFNVGQYLEIQQSINDPEVFSCGFLGCDSNNVTGQITKILAKNGNTLTLERGLHYNYNPAMQPIARNLNLLKNVGIEDLTIYRPQNNESAGTNVQFKYTANCWMRNVWSQYMYRDHLIMWHSYQCEIRDNVFNDAWARGEGGQGYGTEIGLKTSDTLIMNNIYWKLRHGAITAYGTSGNVFAYNYFKDFAAGSSGATINAGWLVPDSNVHGNYPNMNLYEGNVMNTFAGDNVWGSNGPTTVFRNRILRESYFVTIPNAINMFPFIDIGTNNKHFNIVGNELGKYGQEMDGNGWTELADSATGSMLIYIDPTDPEVYSSTLLHGNYEYLSNPNTAVLHLGWKNGYSQTLPPSLFLTSKPAFFGTLDWPAFGPDKINSGNKIPAQVRYETLAAQNKIGPNFVYVLN